MKGVRVGTKTITMYVSDIDRSEIAEGEAYQVSIRHPDGSTQQLDISAKNYRDLKLGASERRSGSAAASPGPPPGWAQPRVGGELSAELIAKLTVPRLKGAAFQVASWPSRCC